MLSNKIGRLILRLVVNTDYIEIKLNTDSSSCSKPLCISAPPVHIAILIFLFPRYWIPESYCRGHWVNIRGELCEIISTALSNAYLFYKIYLKILELLPSFRHILKQRLLTRHFTRKTKIHYDIDAEIYRLFLDKEMVYTCAFFEEGDTLEIAQSRKFEKIMSRLALDQSANNILNIGTGWSSFERFIVKKNPNVLVTGLSISKEQIEWAKEYNLKQLTSEQYRRIILLVEDYLKHSPSYQYDAICVIGMIEHVGLSGYREFFQKCAKLLKPGAKLLVHTIIEAKDRRKTSSWLDQKIFPGGYIPSISELTKGSQKAPLIINNIFIHNADNYYKTLSEWETRLRNNKDKIISIYTEKLGHSNKFSNYLYHQWEIYLAGCKTRFHGKQDTLQVGQFVFEKI